MCLFVLFHSISPWRCDDFVELVKGDAVWFVGLSDDMDVVNHLLELLVIHGFTEFFGYGF